MISFPSNISYFADQVCCFNWVIAYTLCLISNIKEDKPCFPPIASVPILAWEFWAIVQRFTDSYFLLNYVTVVRFLWFSLHFAFFAVAIYKLCQKKKIKTVIFHFILLAVLIFIMYYVFKMGSGQIRTSFFNTMVGWILLIIYILRTEYPATRLNFGFAFFGFIADAAGHFVYLDEDYITSFLCVLLQIIQLIHVLIVYRLLRKAGVSILPYKNITEFENQITLGYRKSAHWFNQNILKKTIPQQRKYKKKQKNKKTHRKK